MYGERDLVFHDREDVRIVYDVLHLPPAAANQARETERAIQTKQDEIERLLDDLEEYFDEVEENHSPSQVLGPQHQRILQLLQNLGHTPSKQLFDDLEEGVRFQRGLKEKFQRGIVLSGMYMKHMHEIFRRHDIPPELAFLPHVESSFDYAARSTAGAAGVWQLMKGTARRFLTINKTIDERLDPLAATEAAARILKDNYAALGNWPLAITAYNHGKNGMLRARQQYGSDLRTIMQRHQSRIFGFASKNFYAEFLAAVEVAQNYERYFGKLTLLEPLQLDELRLRKPLNTRRLVQSSRLPVEVLKSYNPHITDYTWEHAATLPAGSRLKIPEGHGYEVSSFLQELQPRIQSEATASSARYRIRKGDTLLKIARKFRVSVQQLQEANQIPDTDRIYVGQVIRIPQRPAKSSQE
ncbi:MAG: transglycosylase SLT domain-containing protein [Acidobacteria bacterium]|nr:transglycosylase SLT domain-containing protein [Acidobacteriota bacterium]